MHFLYWFRVYKLTISCRRRTWMLAIFGLTCQLLIDPKRLAIDTRLFVFVRKCSPFRCAVVDTHTHTHTHCYQTCVRPVVVCVEVLVAVVVFSCDAALDAEQSDHLATNTLWYSLFLSSSPVLRLPLFISSSVEEGNLGNCKGNLLQSNPKVSVGHFFAFFPKSESFEHAMNTRTQNARTHSPMLTPRSVCCRRPQQLQTWVLPRVAQVGRFSVAATKRNGIRSTK